MTIKLHITEKSKVGKRDYYLNLNGYRNWNYFLSNNLKKAYCPTEEEVPVFEKPIEIEYHFKMRSNADVDNKIIVCKFFHDWLVQNGKLKDDNKQMIKKITMEPLTEDEYNAGETTYVIIKEY